MHETDRHPTTPASVRDTLRALFGEGSRKASMSDVALLLAAADVGGFSLALEIAERAGIRDSLAMVAIARELGLPDYQPHQQCSPWGNIQ